MGPAGANDVIVRTMSLYVTVSEGDGGAIGKKGGKPSKIDLFKDRFNWRPVRFNALLQGQRPAPRLTSSPIYSACGTQ